MKKLILPVVLILTFCSCKQEADQNAAPRHTLPEGALAAVAGEPITQQDFDAAAENLDAGFKDFLKTPAGKENFLNFIINERMLLKAAQANNIEDSAEYKKEMDALRKEQRATLKERHDYLLRTLLEEKLRKDGVIDVSESEIRAYHRKYPYQVTIAQILLSDPQKAAAVMREVSNVRTREKFAEYVRKFSIDPAAKTNGGVMEPFIPGEYLPEIEIPAANSPTFQPQGFIKTPFGFHIIMKVKEESISYNNAKDRIRSILEKQKMDAYLNTLKERYGVEVKNNESK